MEGPWKKTQRNAHPDGEKDESSFSTLLMHALIRTYQETVSSQASVGCPSYPSCSRYMDACLAKFGLIRGVILGLERLLHEGDEVSLGEKISVNGIRLTYDPDQNNTFWWKTFRE